MGLWNRVLGSKQDRFARRVLAQLRDASPLEAWYDADEFAIHVRHDAAPESPVTHHLHDLYAETGDGDRTAQQDRVAAFVALAITPPQVPSEWDRVAPLLRPVLRPGTFGLGMGRGLVLQSRPAGVPFLSEYVRIEGPESMTYVTTHRRNAWGVSACEVFDTARANLAPASWPAAGSGRALRLVEGGEAQWAPRLLLTGGLADLADRIGGRPVAFVPDTTAVVVVPDGPGIAQLFASVERTYREAVRPISPQAYVVDDAGRLAVYDAPTGSPAAAAVHRASLLLAAAEYESQGAALSSSESAFPAKLIVAEGSERVFSVASWVEGVDTLLPRAEYIAFSGAEAFLASWDSVADEVALVPTPGLNPQRFRARSWPPAAAVARLRATAVDL